MSISRLSIGQAFGALSDLVRGDRVDALLSLTEQPDGTHDSISAGVIKIIANSDAARALGMGKSPLDETNTFDKPDKLPTDMNFANGEGLFSASEEDGHRAMRKPLNILGASGITPIVPDMNDEALLLVNNLKNDPDGKVVEHVAAFATRMAMTVFFGVDPDKHRDMIPVIYNAFSKADHEIFYRIVSLNRDDHALLTEDTDASLRGFNTFFDQQLQAVANGQSANESVLTRLVEAAGGKDALSDPKSVAAIKEQLSQAMLAGILSTTSGISWLLHDMAANPQYQNQLRQQIDEPLADGLIDVKDARLPLAVQCIEETLRLHSVVPLTLPRTDTETDGDRMVVSLAAIHRDPRHFPEPDQYKPERMAPEAKKLQGGDAFMPFFVGPHTCPGQILYKTAAATALIHAVNNLKIAAPDGYEEPKGILGISVKPDPDSHLAYLPIEGVRPAVRVDPQALSPAPDAPQANAAPAPGGGCPFKHKKTG